MTIERLMEVLPPPARPFDVYAGPWEPIEAELGTPLPQDYKDFVRVYGCGQILEFFGLYVPKSRNPNVRLSSILPEVAEAFSRDEDLPYPLWPAPGGLVAIGQSDNGDYLFLRRGDRSIDWGVIVWDRGLSGWEPFDCSITDFIAGVVTGEVQPKEFPDDLMPCANLFTPSGPLTDWRSGDGQHLIGIRAYYRFSWNSWRLP